MTAYADFLERETGGGSFTLLPSSTVPRALLDQLLADVELTAEQLDEQLINVTFGEKTALAKSLCRRLKVGA